MSYIIRNEKITVISKEEGAELCSIKSNADGLEFLWQADPAFWGRHAPVLFPIVGKLRDNKTIIEDKEYTMGQHGFARDMIFEVIEKGSESILYRLKSNDVSKEKYPYDFNLYIGYSLNGSEVTVSYKVENTDDKNILFSIGAHPGFNCPLVEGESFEDYYLEFDRPELMDSYRLAGGVISGKKTLLYKEKLTKLDLNEELFRGDAIMLDNMESSELAIKSKKSGRGVALNYKGFPYLGIWSKPEGAPFVCIEPWFGIADTEVSNGLFKDKKGVVELKAGEEFHCSYIIKVF